jgi:hypothetical protein
MAKDYDYRHSAASPASNPITESQTPFRHENVTDNRHMGLPGHDCPFRVIMVMIFV